MNHHDSENNQNQLHLDEINKWINQINPLQTELHKPALAHYFGRGMAAISSLLLYLLGIACMALPFIVKSIYPFHVLNQIQNTREIISAIGSQQTADNFVYAIYTLMIVIGVCLIIIGNQISKG